MSAILAAIIAVRVLALYLGVQVLVLLPQTLTILGSLARSDFDTPPAIKFMTLAAYSLQVLAAVLLWVLAEPISRRMVGPPVAEVVIPAPVGETLVRVILIVVGLYLVTTSVPHLLVLFVSVMQTASTVAADMSLFERLTAERSQVPGLIHGSIQAMLGVAFLIGNSGFAKLVQRARSFALDS